MPWKLAKWDIVERETGKVVDVFECELSRPDAVEKARKMGYERTRFSVRAQLGSDAFTAERKPKDYAALARARRRRS